MAAPHGQPPSHGLPYQARNPRRHWMPTVPADPYPFPIPQGPRQPPRHDPPTVQLPLRSASFTLDRPQRQLNRIMLSKRDPRAPNRLVASNKKEEPVEADKPEPVDMGKWSRIGSLDEIDKQAAREKSGATNNSSTQGARAVAPKEVEVIDLGRKDTKSKASSLATSMAKLDPLVSDESLVKAICPSPVTTANINYQPGKAIEVIGLTSSPAEKDSATAADAGPKAATALSFLDRLRLHKRHYEAQGTSYRPLHSVGLEDNNSPVHEKTSEHEQDKASVSPLQKTKRSHDSISGSSSGDSKSQATPPSTALADVGPNSYLFGTNKDTNPFAFSYVPGSLQKGKHAYCETEDTVSVDESTWGAPLRRSDAGIESLSGWGTRMVSSETSSMVGTPDSDASGYASSIDWEEMGPKSHPPTGRDAQDEGFVGCVELSPVPSKQTNPPQAHGCGAQCKSSELLKEQASDIAALKQRMEEQDRRMVEQDAMIRSFMVNNGAMGHQAAVSINPPVDANVLNTLHRLEVRMAEMQGQQQQQAPKNNTDDLLNKLSLLVSKLEPDTPEPATDMLTSKLVHLESRINFISNNSQRSELKLHSLGDKFVRIHDDLQEVRSEQWKKRDQIIDIHEELDRLADQNGNLPALVAPAEHNKTKADIKLLSRAITDLSQACARLETMYDQLNSRVDTITTAPSDKVDSLREEFKKLWKYVDNYNHEVPRFLLKDPLAKMAEILGVEVDLRSFY